MGCGIYLRAKKFSPKRSKGSGMIAYNKTCWSGLEQCLIQMHEIQWGDRNVRHIHQYKCIGGQGKQV